jgi:hypothetical protein
MTSPLQRPGYAFFFSSVSALVTAGFSFNPGVLFLSCVPVAVGETQQGLQMMALPFRNFFRITGTARTIIEIKKSSTFRTNKPTLKVALSQRR